MKKVKDPRKRQIYRKNTHFRTSREISLQKGFYHIKRIAANLDLPRYVVIDATKLFIDIQSKKLIYGYSYSGIAAACVYRESKKHQYTRPRKYFADQISGKGTDLKSYFNKCYRRIVKGLCLPHLPISPVEYVSQFIHRDELNVDTRTEQKIIKIINIALSRGYFISVNPKGVCAGAIYYVCMKCDISITQKQIAEITGITDATVRSRYKDFQNLSPYFNEVFE